MMMDMLSQLEQIIRERQANPRPESYTNRLLNEGLSRVAQKVGEEGVEVVVAALSQGRGEQIGELADLFYHALVLMAALSITLEDVQAELARRHRLDASH